MPFNYIMKLNWIDISVSIKQLQHLSFWEFNLFMRKFNMNFVFHFYIFVLTSWLWTSPSTEEPNFESPSKKNSYESFNLEHWSWAFQPARYRWTSWSSKTLGKVRIISMESIKQGQKIPTSNRLDLETLGCGPVMPNNLPGHWWKERETYFFNLDKEKEGNAPTAFCHNVRSAICLYLKVVKRNCSHTNVIRKFRFNPGTNCSTQPELHSSTLWLIFTWYLYIALLIPFSEGGLIVRVGIWWRRYSIFFYATKSMPSKDLWFRESAVPKCQKLSIQSSFVLSVRRGLMWVTPVKKKPLWAFQNIWCTLQTPSNTH